MSHMSLRLLGPICAMALSSAQIASAGTLSKVVEGKGVTPTPIAGAKYEKLDIPVVSDDPTKAVLFFSTAKNPGPPRLTSKCFFRVPQVASSGQGEAIACNKGPSPDGNIFRLFSDPRINVTGVAAWGAAVTGDSNGMYKNSAGNAVVAFIGDQVSGVTGSLYFTSDSQDPDAPPFKPGLADNGTMFFKATISGAATVGSGAQQFSVDQGIFRCTGPATCSPSSLQKIVLKNDDVLDRDSTTVGAPPGTKRRFCGFGPTVAASNAGFVFRASIRNSCRPDTVATDPARVGIFRKKTGLPVETIALEGEASNPAPGVGGSKYTSSLASSIFAINNAGDVAFSGSTSGLINGTFIFFCGASDACQPSSIPAAVAVEQDGSDTAGNRFLELIGLGMSDARDIAFRASIRKPNKQNGDGIYIKRDGANIAGAIDAVAITEQTPVPGELSTIAFTGFKGVGMSTGGKVVFKGTFRSTVPPKNKREGIFLWVP